MPSRRSARNQPLPKNEAFILNRISGDELYLRCRELYEAGWTLRAIADAMNPPVSRSTVHSWITNLPMHIQLPIDPLPPVDPPEYATPKEYVKKTKPSPGILPHQAQNIRDLAPLARKYRSRIPEGAPAYQANQALTLICKALHADGVTIQELADVAGVSYRAMAKRVGKS
jgi:hypothetical protein